MSDEQKEANNVGKTTATEETPNTVEEFYFWVEPGKIINPFDFVSVEHLEGSITVGLVTSMKLVTDAKSQLADYVSNEFGKVETTPQTPRLQATIAKAVVMGNITTKEGIPEILMPIESNKIVRFGSEEEVRAGLGLPDILHEKRINIGIIEMSNKSRIPIFIDSDYLLGPQGAHLNISGITGLATKTSYIMFLIQLLYQKMKDKLAVIIFNVKQDDLLHLHEEPTDIQDSDREMYEQLGIKEETFPLFDPQKTGNSSGIKYFLPRDYRGQPNSLYLPKFYFIYAYALSDSFSRLDLLFHGVPDPYFTMRGIIDYIMENYKQGIFFKKEAYSSGGIKKQVLTWEDLKLFSKEPSNFPNEIVRYTRTAYRFAGLLKQFTPPGLFVSYRSDNEVYLGEEIKKIKAGDIYVIDIAKIDDEREQAFIIGDVMRSLDEMYTERREEEIPEKIIVYIDELNRYAPRVGGFEEPSPVTEQIREIARTGRSRGTVLFSAEQFMSSVDRQIIENCAMQVVGRSGSSELSSDVYRFLDAEVKEVATRLKKGEVIISHPTFRRPIKIKFPKPYYKRIG